MMAGPELLGTLIETGAASSVAVLLVVLLRRRVRAGFGAGAAYAMWGLVPAALIAVLLPAAAQAPALASMTALVAPAAPQTLAAEAVAYPDHVPLVLSAWALGALLAAVWFGAAQYRFRRRLGRLHLRPDGLQQARTRAGLPAVMGIIRPRIVVPADFEQRYDAAERALMQAHERMHIRGGDLQANALATGLRCLFWFNPLLHLAWPAFRHDQELACDQRVLARHPQARRAYGKAMLKTQLAVQPSPLACHWGYGHPLKERIAMLTRPLPSRTRRHAGFTLVCLLTLGTGFAAWSVQPARAVAPAVAPPPATPATPATPARHVVEVDAQAVRATVPGPLPPAPAASQRSAVPAPPAPPPMPSPPPPLRAPEAPPAPPVPSAHGVPPAPPAAEAPPAPPVPPSARVPPRYPTEALAQGLSGKVVLVIDIDAGGKPSAVVVERAEPAGVFDAAAVDAA